MKSERQFLNQICSLVESTVSTNSIPIDSYVSTENMLPNKQGITVASKLPSTKMVKHYNSQDVLVSNIRPYFKKIWFADRDGGCSNDVLVFRAAGCNLPRYLYYLLSQDIFFTYASATSKGTKMPRGDKESIMTFSFPKLPFHHQKSSSLFLRTIDDRITTLRSINHHLFI